jgi:hypothetical protein
MCAKDSSEKWVTGEGCTDFAENLRIHIQSRNGGYRVFGYARKRVCHDIRLAGNVLYFEVIFLHEFSLSRSSSSEIGLRCEMSKCCMVGLNQKPSAEEINAPSFQGVNDSEELLFVSWTVSFRSR